MQEFVKLFFIGLIMAMFSAEVALASEAEKEPDSENSAPVLTMAMGTVVAIIMAKMMN
jgi:hypothetical protein